MSLTLDAKLTSTGTRFRIFPQSRFLQAFKKPETIYVSPAPQAIKPGPADDRFYVLDAINKRPYDQRHGRVDPYSGPVRPLLKPGADGHFDHFDVESRDFLVATMYATVRRVLDIWEDYFGRTIEWHFNLDFERLELVPLIEWDNAHSGYGFLEFGYDRLRPGVPDHSKPHCENFDALAHELGHSLIFAEIPTPPQPAQTTEYWGHHEAAGDLVAIVAALHSDRVVSHLLDSSRGNLFTPNVLNRIGDVSASKEVRKAFNDERMSTVPEEEHELSKPLTGALFDVFVEVFQKELVKRGLITQKLADRSNHGPDDDEDDPAIQAEFNEAYAGNKAGFQQALLEARDYLGTLLARTWTGMSPYFFTYSALGRKLLSVDRHMGGQHQETIRSCFQWREIRLPKDSPPHRIRTLNGELGHCTTDTTKSRHRRGRRRA
ncbi:MAG: hypothetical protein AB1411_06095 [Nitrospirota bacterium]